MTSTVKEAITVVVISKENQFFNKNTNEVVKNCFFI